MNPNAIIAPARSAPRHRRATAGLSAAGGFAALRAIFAAWDRHRGPVPPDELSGRLEALRLTRADVAAHAQFDAHCYRRNLLHSGPGYDALLLCWRSGQRSPIHDHRGSACAVRVVEGVASETIYDRSPSGLVFPTRTEHFKPGYVTASYDSDIHQMGNLQSAGSDLITLHVYSPPLRFMQLYYVGDAVIGERGDALGAALRSKKVRGRPLEVQAGLAAIRQRARAATAKAKN